MTTAVKTALPKVSHVINYGTEIQPRGEVIFDGGRLVIGFGDGCAWRRKGGFGLKEPHFRAAFAYLTQIGLPGYARFSSSRVGRLR